MSEVSARRTQVTLSIGMLLAALALWIDYPLATAVKIAFILIVPGGAIMQLSGLALSLFEFYALSLIMSLATSALLATAAVYLGFWSPSLIFYVLLGMTALLLIIDLWREGDRLDDDER